MRALAAILVSLAPLLGTASALPGPGLNGETTERIPFVGRLFPEALQTNDYIGYFEAIPSLEKLARDFPDRIELFRVGTSLGWMNPTSGRREPHDVLAFEVTNEKSSVPFEDRIHLVFACSIHGNEKGGREGCLRVVEDFAKGIGLAAQKPELVRLLDYMVLAFVIPNTDGWTHDELQYVSDGPSSMYTRGNANGTDLNRQWPTLGFLEASRNHRTMAEPEIGAVAPFLKARYPNVWYAVDIHGMLNPADAQNLPAVPGNCSPANPGACPTTATDFQAWLAKNDKGHFLLGLLSAAQLTQDEFIRQTRMAELVRERTSSCPGTLGPTWCSAPSTGAWGGAYNFWGTSWETIGYTASGSTSNFMMSPFGLNAPAATYEMAYNHIVCDGLYPGCGAYMNEFHVNNVRRIVESLMEAARTDFRVSLETEGVRTAYVSNPRVVTTADANGKPRASGGWSDQNPLDDAWDTLHNVYTASSVDYLRDMGRYVRDDDRPGVFDELRASEIGAAALQRYDQLIVAGSAFETLEAAQLASIGDWVRGGGTLVLTDQSMQLLEALGVVKGGSVRTLARYVGHTEVVDYSHPLAKDLLGYSRQTYDPVSLGIPQGSAPVWVVETSEVSAAGTVVGVVPEGSGGVRGSRNANLGEMFLGQGRIRFLGALLPDPTVEHYTPYGVGSYGVTYAGNQFFINLLGFNQVFEAPPRALEAEGNLKKPTQEPSAPSETHGDGLEAASDPNWTSGLGVGAALLGALASLMLARRLRQRR